MQGVKKTRRLFHWSAPEAGHTNPLHTVTYPYHCHYIYISTHCSRFPVELVRGFHFFNACNIPHSALSLHCKASCYAISTQIYVSHPSNANFRLLFASASLTEPVAFRGYFVSHFAVRQSPFHTFFCSSTSMNFME